MKDFLNSLLNRCNVICDLAYDIVEEVNDGDSRPALVLSSVEAVYCLQDLVRSSCCDFLINFKVSSMVKL